MEWIVIVGLVAYIIYTRYRISRAADIQTRVINALLVSGSTAKDRQNMALNFIDNLANTLLHGEYDKYMMSLCRSMGVVYTSDDGYVISREAKGRLAQRIAQEADNIALLIRSQ